MSVIDWMARAACRHADPELFYARTLAEIEEAKSVCDSCPVKAICADYSKDEVWGVWAGEDKHAPVAARIAERQEKYREEAKKRAEEKRVKDRAKRKERYRQEREAVAAYEAGDRSERVVALRNSAMKAKQRKLKNEEVRRKRIMANANRYKAGDRDEAAVADYERYRRHRDRNNRMAARHRARKEAS